MQVSLIMLKSNAEKRPVYKEIKSKFESLEECEDKKTCLASIERIEADMDKWEAGFVKFIKEANEYVDIKKILEC